MPKGDKSVSVNVTLCPYLHMVWNNKRLESGELLYRSRPEGITEEMIFEESEALAHLLATGQVFINDYWWMKAQWPEECTKLFSINANANDIFMWGAADAEEVLYSELEDLYEHYHKDPVWGTAIWCIKKRGFMPQKHVEMIIREAGVWNLDEMNLTENPQTAYYRKQAEEKTFIKSIGANVRKTLKNFVKRLK